MTIIAKKPGRNNDFFRLEGGRVFTPLNLPPKARAGYLGHPIIETIRSKGKVFHLVKVEVEKGPRPQETSMNVIFTGFRDGDNSLISTSAFMLSSMSPTDALKSAAAGEYVPGFKGDLLRLFSSNL